MKADWPIFKPLCQQFVVISRKTKQQSYSLSIYFGDVRYEYFHTEGGIYVGQDYMCHV